MLMIAAVAFTMLVAPLPVYDMATNAVVKRAEGRDPAKCLARFLDYPPSRGKLGFPRCLFQDPFPKNPDFWLNDVDMSCASPWNDSFGTLRAGTAISKRHVIFAKHFPLHKGVRILFVGQDGGVCPCSIEATKELATCDIAIGLLNAEVTPNIHPAKILPDDYEKYIGDGFKMPVVTLNQREEAVLGLLNALSPHKTIRTVCCHPPDDPRMKSFRKGMIGGDSGSPSFLLVGKELVFLNCVYNSGGGAGPAIHRRREEVQAAMDELCPGYKLEAFDFSALSSK